MTSVTSYGSYEFMVMPFRLTNARATFCNLMNDVLYEFLDEFVVVYLDDIVIFSRSMDGHVVYLDKVLSRLKEHELFVKKEKCEFACSEIMFLGAFGEFLAGSDGSKKGAGHMGLGSLVDGNRVEVIIGFGKLLLSVHRGL